MGGNARISQVPSRCDCQPGNCIDGKYVVISELGEGSFGKVFKVRDGGGEIHALKLLRLWDVVSEIREPLIARFEMEFKTGRIPSRNLVHSSDYGYLNGNPYFVMEFCPGGDITKCIGKKDCDFSKYAMDILNGLNDLHVNGKVHRDLKPENVLLKEDGTAVLTDFGISGDKNRRLTEKNIFGRPYQLFGTYAYMPPEQSNRARGNCTVLPTTDLFSFGVLMYQLITGVLPFGKLEDQNDLAKYIMNSQAGRWDKARLEMAPGGNEWAPLIGACLLPSWKERIQSAVEALRLVPENKSIQTDAQHCNTEGKDHNHPSGCYLKIMQGLNYGMEYNLDEVLHETGKGLIRVGLDFSNDIFLLDYKDSYTSHRHFTIERGRHSSWVIRDGQWIPDIGEWVRSTNGTWLNSCEVTDLGLELRDGDIISAGDVKIRFNKYNF